MDVFSNTVKSTTDTASESVTTYGYHFVLSHSDPARITGRTGRTHGARIVSIPARNAVIAKVILERFVSKKI